MMPYWLPCEQAATYATPAPGSKECRSLPRCCKVRQLCSRFVDSGNAPAGWCSAAFSDGHALKVPWRPTCAAACGSTSSPAAYMDGLARLMHYDPAASEAFYVVRCQDCHGCGGTSSCRKRLGPWQGLDAAGAWRGNRCHLRLPYTCVLLVCRLAIWLCRWPTL